METTHTTTETIHKIRSQLYKYYDYILIKKNINGIREMQFISNNEVVDAYQTMYNINDIEVFYLTYFYPLLSFIAYIDKFETCLLIGMGGGHIPTFLKHKLPHVHTDVVEIDPGVITAAKIMGYTGNAICIDGIEFIKNCHIKNITYDAIVIDLDDLSSYDNFNFLNISVILNHNGILALNVYCPKVDKLIRFGKLLTKLKIYFKCIKCYKLNENRIYLCKVKPDLEIMLTDVTSDMIKEKYAGYKYSDVYVNKLKKMDASIYLS